MVCKLKLPFARLAASVGMGSNPPLAVMTMDVSSGIGRASVYRILRAKESAAVELDG